METEIFEGYDNFLKGWTRIKEHDGSTVAYTPDRITAETFIHATNLFPELVEAMEAYHCPMCAASIECQDDYCYRVRTVLAKAKDDHNPTQAEKDKACNLFPELVQWLNVILDQVDYMSGACAVTEMVGAVLDRRIIVQARAVLAKAKASSVPDTYTENLDPPNT